MREGLSTDSIIFGLPINDSFVAVKVVDHCFGLKIIDDAGNDILVDSKYRAQMLIQALEQAIDFDWVK